MSEKTSYAYKLEANKNWTPTEAQCVMEMVKEIKDTFISKNDDCNLIIIEASRLLATELVEIEGLKAIFSIDIVK